MNRTLDALTWAAIGLAALFAFDYVAVGTVAHMAAKLFDQVSRALP